MKIAIYHIILLYYILLLLRVLANWNPRFRIIIMMIMMMIRMMMVFPLSPSLIHSLYPSLVSYKKLSSVLLFPTSLVIFNLFI